MREYNCIVCGKRDIDFGSRKDKRFCSKICANAYYRQQKFVFKKEYPACIFNDAVQCEVHKCRNCGWNPVVSIRRKEAYNNG